MYISSRAPCSNHLEVYRSLQNCGTSGCNLVHVIPLMPILLEICGPLLDVSTLLYHLYDKLQSLKNKYLTKAVQLKTVNRLHASKSY